MTDPSPLSSSTSSSLPLAPPPWTCKATAYILPFFTSSKTPLPTSRTHAPLEARSSAWISGEHSGEHKGGCGFVQILRYTDTPVGAYDELVVMPGYFEAPENVGCKGKHLRITGIWVSQEATCFNGRRNWNIPKHVATFKFTPTTSAALPLKVEVSDPKSSAPFFTATVHPTPYTPTFPFSSSWQGYFGLPTYCLQPPLPTGENAEVEVGTEAWMRSAPSLKTSRARIVWLDMEQPKKDSAAASAGTSEGDALLAKEDNWWPGWRKWRLGMVLEDATLHLGHPELYHASPKL